MESIRLFRKDKVIVGGIILALAINIKLLPIVLIPYLIYRNYFKAIASFSFFSLVFLFFSAIFLGWSKNSFLLSEWWNVINPSNSQHLIETELGTHSLSALIPSLLTETEGEIDIRRNVFSFGSESAILILNIVRAFFVTFTIYFLKWPPFKRNNSKLFQIYELSYLVLIIPLIFPHMQKYAFVLSIPALFYLSHFVVLNFRNGKSTVNAWRMNTILILIFLSFVLMTLSTDGLIGRNLNDITQHFKTITWGALLLVVALILAKPKFSDQFSKQEAETDKADI
jgi:hypothetical protein